MPQRRSWFAYISAGLGLSSLLAVACFHFPELLTSREFRQVYTESFARNLLLAGLVVAFVLGTVAILRGRDRRVALVGVGSSTLAVLAGGRWATRSPVRHASMGIDTLLLVAALLLLFVLQLNPFAVAWLRVKLMLLVAYIVLGTFALKRARGTGARALFFIAALACFLMMYSVARTHNPLGLFA